MEKMNRENTTRGVGNMNGNDITVLGISVLKNSVIVVFMIKDSGEVEIVLVPL